MMDVTELNREQLTELKQNYYSELVNEGTFAEVIGRNYDEPSYDDLADADEIVSDDFIFEHYKEYEFNNGNFFCTADLD
jgi:hypothetical protein